MLEKINKSQRVLPTSLEFVDIAGLVKGASKGAGLGNQFLGNIRQVDAIVHVVRCFEDDDIVHVDGSVDPVRDMEVNTFYVHQSHRKVKPCSDAMRNAKNYRSSV